MEDFVIRHAQIFDGTSAEPFVADVSVKSGRIEAVGPNLKCDNGRVIDADGLSLMPGIIQHAAREFVEHPESVAQRTIRYAEIVGRENVIIGTDCGLSRVAHAEVQWAKFRAAAEGARLATQRLWGK